MIGSERPALFQVGTLTFAGDRSYRDTSDGTLLAQAFQRDRSPWRSLMTAGEIMDFRDPSGAALLSVGRIPPGFRLRRWAPIFWPNDQKAGTIKPVGFVHCDFQLCGLDGATFATAERQARGFRESYQILDGHRTPLGTVIEPEASVRAMSERGALPTSRWLNVELDPGIPDILHLLILGLPQVIRMRHGWDHRQA
ncbi:hypothetical protein [Actinomadura rubrisoli]|uniref:Uncharacterized protein n=1 Tax=Actinomadura rubrisoli TaxID=2530368 RepID=A0A4R5B356_9ACTN|nr:hypothetical protein [Actinomadura rubrisoli]TDD79615.1 hypothetical protein E1298_27370 [Actinomadura rubrisoli]